MQLDVGNILVKKWILTIDKGPVSLGVCVLPQCWDYYLCWLNPARDGRKKKNGWPYIPLVIHRGCLLLPATLSWYMPLLLERVYARAGREIILVQVRDMNARGQLRNNSSMGNCSKLWGRTE